MERIELKGGSHVGASAKRCHDLGGRQVLPEIGPRRPSEPLECEIDVEEILDREPLVHDFPREGADLRDYRGLGCGSRKQRRGSETTGAKQHFIWIRALPAQQWNAVERPAEFPSDAPDERVKRVHRRGDVRKVVGLPDVDQAVVLADDSPRQVGPLATRSLRESNPRRRARGRTAVRSVPRRGPRRCRDLRRYCIARRGFQPLERPRAIECRALRSTRTSGARRGRWRVAAPIAGYAPAVEHPRGCSPHATIEPAQRVRSNDAWSRRPRRSPRSRPLRRALPGCSP